MAGTSAWSSLSASLCFVTKNKHKFEEISLIARPLGFNLRLCSNLEKLEVQSESLVDIALKAAESLAEKGLANVIVEDAGLFVKSLSGFPGPYSSYVYRTIGCSGILKLLEEEDDRRAYFESIIAFVDGKGRIRVFEGRVYGLISYRAIGEKGFGFDPIFIPAGYSRTFAEMTLEEKSWISHRGRSALKLFRWLKYYEKEI